MKHQGSANAVLLRILAGEFYRQNAGFFLLTFLLCFGVFDASATIRLHRGLMQMMATRPTALAVGLGIWALYFLKVVGFSIKMLGTPACRFLCESQGLSAGQAWRRVLLPVLLMALPAILYNGVAAFFAVQDRQLLAALCLALFPLIGASAIAGFCLRQMHGAHKAPWLPASGRLATLTAGARLPFLRWPLAHFLAERRLLILSIKAFSLLLIQGLMWVNENQMQREGTYYLVLLAVAIHAALPYQAVRFLERYPWLRAMPEGILSRHLQLCALWALLALPELLYLLLHRPAALSVGLVLSLYLLIVALLSVLHTAAYLRGGDMGRYLLMTVVGLLVTLLLLTAFPVWALGVGWAVMGAGCFWYLYPRYESSGVDG